MAPVICNRYIYIRYTHVNFLTEEEGSERIHAAYRNNYHRIVEVKTKWDAENLFQINKNIVTKYLQQDRRTV